MFRSAMLFLIVGVFFTGCASVGPGSIKRDHFDNSYAVGQASKEELLRNIVRLRYLDAPVFLRVNSIINQYSLEGSVSLSALNSDAADAQTLGGTGRWSDRPTITYTPLSGSVFAQNLLTPIPPDALLALIQAGWSAEFLFRIGVRSMNSIENASAEPATRKAADPQFRELLELWFRLRKQRILGLRRDGSGADVRFFVYIREGEVSPALKKDEQRLRAILGLGNEANEFAFSYGLVPDEKNQIALLTSSILEIMSELSWHVEVPDSHIELGRTLPSFQDQQTFETSIFHVRSSESKPRDTYVAVFERGTWFYVDDSDLISKRTFALLQILLSLAESGDSPRGPVVTIGG